MKKILATMLCVMLMICALPVAADGIGVLYANVEDGAEGVSISPVFDFTFSEAVKEDSLSNISLSGGTQLDVKMSEDRHSIMVRCKSELLYYTTYTLDLTGIMGESETILDGVKYTFKTKFGSNSLTSDPKMLEDNFESYTIAGENEGEYRFKTSAEGGKWRNDKYCVVKVKEKDGDKDNRAVFMNKSDILGGSAQFYNYNMVHMDIENMALLSFDILFESGSATVDFLDMMGTEGQQGQSILRYVPTEEKLYLKDGSSLTGATCTLETDTWTNIKVLADLKNAKYIVYVNGNVVSDEEGNLQFPIKSSNSDFKGARLDGVRFQMRNAITWLDNVTYRQVPLAKPLSGYATLSLGGDIKDAGEISSLEYTFSKELDSDTAYGFALNEDASLVKSAQVDGKKLTLTLSKPLQLSSEYKVTFGALSDKAGVPVSGEGKVTTKFVYNLVYDDFENGFDASKTNGDTKWRINESGAEECVDDIVTGKAQGKVVHLTGTSEAAARLDNYTRLSGGFNMPGDAVVEFKCLIPKSMSTVWYRPYLSVFGTKEDGTPAENTGMLIIEPQNEGANFNIYFGDKEGGKSFGNLTCTKATDSNYNFDEWIKITFVIDTFSSTYRAFINGTDTGKTYSLKVPFATDTLNQIRFSCGNGYEIYLDDLKIAQKMAVLNGTFYGSDGEECEVLDGVKTVYKAKVVNNGPADEKIKLVKSVINKKSGEAEKIEIINITACKESATNVEILFENLGDKAEECDVKIFWLYGKNFLNVREKIVGKNKLLPANDGSAHAKKSYPGGKMKAVTFSLDDGNPLDKNIISVMNENGLRGTFNIVGGRSDGTITSVSAISYSEFAEVYKGHEVANHSYSHPTSFETLDDFKEDLLLCDNVIKSGVGVSAKGYAYPNNIYPSDTEGMTKFFKDNGYIYARGGGITYSFDIPKSEDFYFLQSTVSFGLTPTQVKNKANEYIKLKSDTLTQFYMCGHSHDIKETGKEWTPADFEEFAALIGGHDDMWYCTNYELYSYLAAMEKLTISETEIKNGSDIALWCIVNGEAIEIKANETYSLN